MDAAALTGATVTACRNGHCDEAPLPRVPATGTSATVSFSVVSRCPDSGACNRVRNRLRLEHNGSPTLFVGLDHSPPPRPPRTRSLPLAPHLRRRATHP